MKLISGKWKGYEQCLASSARTASTSLLKAADILLPKETLTKEPSFDWDATKQRELVLLERLAIRSDSSSTRTGSVCLYKKNNYPKWYC